MHPPTLQTHTRTHTHTLTHMESLPPLELMIIYYKRTVCMASHY